MLDSKIVIVDMNYIIYIIKFQNYVKISLSDFLQMLQKFYKLIQYKIEKKHKLIKYLYLVMFIILFL